MCTKFQVDWTSTSSITTLTKHFNQKVKPEVQANGRMNKKMKGRTD